MAAGEAALIVTSVTGLVSGAGALWLGFQKHRADTATQVNDARIDDAETRIAEWVAINDRIEADNVRLRYDNNALRSDNDRLRGEMLAARAARHHDERDPP